MEDIGGFQEGYEVDPWVDSKGGRTKINASESF